MAQVPPAEPEELQVAIKVSLCPAAPVCHAPSLKRAPTARLPASKENSFQP